MIILDAASSEEEADVRKFEVLPFSISRPEEKHKLEANKEQPQVWQ